MTDQQPAIRLTGLTKEFGAVTAVDHVDLEIAAGEFFSMLGPSGSGKTTVLRLIAGFEQPTSGTIELFGTDVTKRAPFDRDVNTVFQDYALFPHMNVLDNVAYGLRVRGIGRKERNERARRALASVRLEQLADRKPSQLSGGQRQRVAIGRAIVRNPEVFLFDEPLSNLDAALRLDMRIEIGKLHKSLDATMIYVTHDQVEAMTLADKIVVLRAGNIEQVGAPLDLYRDPDNQFVAGFIGSPSMNFLAAKVEGGRLVCPGLGGPVDVEAALPAEGTDVTLGLRPEHLEIDPQGATHKVDLAEALGGVSYAYLMCPSGEKLIVEERGDHRSQIGGQVGLTFEPRRAYLFDPETGSRLR